MTNEPIFGDPSVRRSLGAAPLRGPWYARFRHGFWSRLPRPLRQSALRGLLARRRAPLAEGAPANEPVCVVGLLSTATGIGQGARLAVRGLAALGHDVRAIDVSALLEGAPADPTSPPPLESGAGTTILHFNPDNLPAILTLLGRNRLRGKRIIGYWAWELARMPKAWLPALAEVDEVWTPTQFVAEAIRPYTTRPVRVVPHPAALEPPGTARRGYFGMEAEFVALSMFSFASFTRKNPVGAVRAFRRAFGEARDRQLIVKCVGKAAPGDMRELREAIDGSPNIRLDDHRLDAGERLDLIASADALLSLHRSEGFGLVIAEAMHAGVPVIATGWSGNMDYMDESCARLVPYSLVDAVDSRGVYAGSGGRWAEPDIDAAAGFLEALAARPAGSAAMRRAARARARVALGLEAFSRAAEPGLPVPARLDRVA